MTKTIHYLFLSVLSYPLNIQNVYQNLKWLILYNPRGYLKEVAKNGGFVKTSKIQENGSKFRVSMHYNVMQHIIK